MRLEIYYNFIIFIQGSWIIEIYTYSKNDSFVIVLFFMLQNVLFDNNILNKSEME